ncbi:MAG TPA: homoserine kinase [Rectinemataceae bacterium]
MKFSITVPATSANLGPGFDSLGLALSLYNRFEVSYPGSGRISGCEARFACDDNLFISAMRWASGRLGFSPPPIDLDIEAAVPVARGLGSSATMIAGGAAAALVLAGKIRGDFSAADRAFVLEAAAAMEGHPDNAAPAVWGGFCASILGPGAGQVTTHSCPVDPLWRFHALVPPFELSTAVARAALPDSIPRSDAVYNLGRAALVALAFERMDLSLLASACSDRLHQPYRARLIPGWDRIVDACFSAGAAAVWLSGAGPTVMAVTDEKASSSFAISMEPILESMERGPWKIFSLSADPGGLRLFS